MTSRTAIVAYFDTTLERAFKTPMLSDVTRVHSGWGAMPRVTHCTDDAGWGQPGGSRKVFAAPTVGFKGGEAALDVVLERRENEYWKIEVRDLQYQMLGFERFQGEWITTPQPDGRIRIDYRYAMISKVAWLYPLQWVFTKTVWRLYMKHVLENIREMVREEAAYLHG